jgi:arylsulfatase A-like enzyme
MRKYLMVLLVGLFAISLSAKDTDKPNIILIMADDIGWECFPDYGGEDYQTPNLDSLASKGVRFRNCFSTPICTPSRVKLMTGKYNFRNYTHFGYLNPKEKTFGHMMKDAGYKTAIAGKWQLNGLYNSLPGSDDNMRPVKAGFDEYCLWQLTRGKGGDGGERFWSPPLEMNGKFLTKEDNHNKFGPDIMSDFICDFIDRNQDGPFFVYYPMVLVHDPFVPTPDSIGSAPRTHETNKAPKDKDAKKANFVAMVNYMDKIVGKIVNKVDAIGQLENTIIMFTADNGTNTGITSDWNDRQIKGGKGGMKDMGTHVPFYAYWKGKTPKGVALDDMIDFTDFYATLAEAAGHKLGADDPVDGRSFLPRLKGQKGDPREWVLWHYEPYWNKKTGQFARNENYKLYRDGSFYKLPDDLEEEHNLAIDQSGKAAKAAHKKLKAILDQCPPPPTGSGSRSTSIEDRPVYPDYEIND